MSKGDHTLTIPSISNDNAVILQQKNQVYCKMSNVQCKNTKLKHEARNTRSYGTHASFGFCSFNVINSLGESAN